MLDNALCTGKTEAMNNEHTDYLLVIHWTSNRSNDFYCKGVSEALAVLKVSMTVEDPDRDPISNWSLSPIR